MTKHNQTKITCKRPGLTGDKKSYHGFKRALVSAVTEIIPNRFICFTLLVSMRNHRQYPYPLQILFLVPPVIDQTFRS
jgi:hypothetical protein